MVLLIEDFFSNLQKYSEHLSPFSYANWPEIEEVNPILYPASDFLIHPFSDSKMPE